MATTSQHFLPFRPTVGLLTTVAELPHNYKIRYITPESPLDLSVKPVLSPMTPPSTPSPSRKRIRLMDSENSEMITDNDVMQPSVEQCIKTETQILVKEVTPNKPIKQTTAPKTLKNPPPSNKDRKHKAVRKLKFDEHKSSPVSGTIIRTLEDIEDDGIVQESGDIDPQYNIVEVTEEAKAEIAAIPNVIGSYACKLCRNEYDDAFGLARHRCSCIVLLEYRCPECGKRFNCPANLASHRRWHKPKDEVVKKKSGTTDSENQFPCTECGKFFKRQAYLRKHMATHKTKSTTSLTTTLNKPKNHCENTGSLSTHSDDSNSNNSIDFHTTTNYTSNDSSGDRMMPSFLSTESSSNKNTYHNFKNSFTEEENMAAAALAHLRNGPTVIRHTTALTV